jgi:hypothetical protein
MKIMDLDLVVNSLYDSCTLRNTVFATFRMVAVTFSMQTRSRFYCPEKLEKTLKESYEFWLPILQGRPYPLLRRNMEACAEAWRRARRRTTCAA